MSFQDGMEFVLQNPNGFTATAEGDQPHVRPLPVGRADETGIYSYLPEFKQVYTQLRKRKHLDVQPACRKAREGRAKGSRGIPCCQDV